MTAAVTALVRGTGRAPSRAWTMAAAILACAAAAVAFHAFWPAEGRPAAGPPARLSATEAAAADALVRRAEGLVSVSPSDLGYSLRVAGPREGIRAQVDTAARTITLFVAPGDAAHRVAHDLGHELGHAVDAERLSATDRLGYLQARGAPGATWAPGDSVSDYDSGAGDFAEVFALCHAASPEFRSRLASRPADPCALLPTSARGAMLDGGGT